MTRSPLRIWYDHQPFTSHARSATDTLSVLKDLCTLVPNPDTADVVVLHHEPVHYRRMLQDVPGLRRKYVIGYGVWETDALPQEMIAGCRYVDEIWTPSTFSIPAFEKHHPRVTWMPHVVHPRPPVPDDAREELAKLLDTKRPVTNFLHITQDGVARKNTDLLLRAFEAFNRRAPDTRLIVKTIRYPFIEGTPPQTYTTDHAVHIRGKLPHVMVAALLDLCDVYVSPHAAEGWGLPLADAMMARRPVIATGYSGNMDFMTAHNAYLVNYSLGRIQPRQVHYLFTQAMTWAFPHREHLESQLWLAYQQLKDGSAAQKVQRAYDDIQAYNPQNVAHYVANQLARIATYVAPTVGKNAC